MWQVMGRHKLHKRDFAIFADSVVEAKVVALELAAFYATGSGTYGPMVWREGSITIMNEHCEEHVVRRMRPDYLTLVVDNTKIPIKKKR